MWLERIQRLVPTLVETIDERVAPVSAREGMTPLTILKLFAVQNHSAWSRSTKYRQSTNPLRTVEED
jgi:hypothetical protein